MTQPLWSDERIYDESSACMGRCGGYPWRGDIEVSLRIVRDEYEAELEKARAELAAANAKVAELTEACAKFAEALYLQEPQ